MLRLLCSGIALLLVSGCASYGVVEKAPALKAGDEQSYSIKSFMKGWRSKENALILGFSGGGTRAAALSYGVLKELRDTPVIFEGKTIPLVDEVSTISSVSGGELLRNDPEFRRLLSDLEADRHRSQHSGAAKNAGSASTRQPL